ncbi:inositol polyphosphate multikinase-like [Tropilaelaps mercedesae]|uniref:Kinase n=1 Tax=Tropilaelaps mercedesae TaxID=418985 RepID=A0A1V9X5H4_9ACAR|nr:inositol polyphosphate multikinase-like [Tropilaelaps mercedesae]
MSSWGSAVTTAGGSVHVECYRMAVVGGAAAPHGDTADKGRALRAAFSFRTATANDIGNDSDHHRPDGASAHASQPLHADAPSSVRLASGDGVHQAPNAPSADPASAMGITAAAAISCPAAPPVQEQEFRSASVSTPTPLSAEARRPTMAGGAQTGDFYKVHGPATPARGEDASATLCNVAVPLPRSTMSYDQQIAGHRHGYGKTKLGMLRHQDGSILKPLMPNDVRAGREHDFYQFLERHREICPEGQGSEECDDPVVHDLIDLTPRYLGVFETDFAVPVAEGRGVSYMKLEDLCRPFKQPCIADLKIGRVTYDPEATAEKIKQYMTKYPAQWEIGYRILGMRVFERGVYRVYDADYGLQQTADSVVDAIRTFVGANPACLPLIITELDRIMEWFVRQRRFAFYSSSILFVYDAVEPRCSVKLIDFAHVFPTTKADENYLFGLRKLVDAFRFAASEGSDHSPPSS